MAVQHVVAQVDGGRVRIRTQVETRKRKGVKYRRKIRVEWREPKLLIVYLSDRKGRMLRGTRPWIAGTINGTEHLIELMELHVNRRAARPGGIVRLGQGADLESPGLGRGRAELDPKRIERSWIAAAHHLSLRCGR
jgi:hypothetical protein